MQMPFVLNNLPIQRNPKKVVICIPGRSFSNKFILSWSDMLFHMYKSGKYIPIISNHYSSFVSFARAACLGANVMAGPDQKPFQGELDYDIILWLDSDMVFSWELIEELLDSCTEQKPIVSGIYAMEGGKQLCCVEHWDTQFYANNGTFEFMTCEEGEQRIRQGKEWVKCAYAGMGCMAIKSGLIEDSRFKYPWFFCDIKKIYTNRPEMQYLTDGTSEDVSFIRNMIDNGIIDSVNVNLRLRFGHEKTVVI